MTKTASEYFADKLKENDLVLAPMAGAGTPVFRGLCAGMGAGLTYSEMVSAAALTFNNRKTMGMLDVSPEETDPVLQLFGSDPDTVARAVELTGESGFRTLDLNAGCPVRKVLSSGSGSALLEDPGRLEKIVASMAAASSKPVSVKIRIGAGGVVNGTEAAKRAEGAGAGMIAVHGRTREQMYSGKADWGEIARVVRAVSIPVCANGDVVAPADYFRIKEATGAAGVMIGRGALGNPFIFRQIAFAREGREGGEPDAQEMARVMCEHLGGLVASMGEKPGVESFRKHFFWYSRRIPGSARLRAAANTAAGTAAMVALIEDLCSSL